MPALEPVTAEPIPRLGQAPGHKPDATVEDALLSASRAFHSPKLAADVRQALAAGAEVEFAVKIRKHHDDAGYCLKLIATNKAPSRQVFYRVKLK